MLTQRQIDKREGHAETFWKNVDKREDGKWIWTGYINKNHNGVDCEQYEYGVFKLSSKETSNFSKANLHS